MTVAAVAVESSENDSPVARIVKMQAFQILLVLIAIWIVFAVQSPDKFATVGNMRLIAQNAAILAILGVGMTFVIITSGIDLSIGSVMVFSGVIGAKVMIWEGGDGWTTAAYGVVASVLSGLAWGLLNGVLIAKAKIPPLIVTLGTLGMALGAAQIITKGVDIREVPTIMQDKIGYGNAFGQVPTLTIIALAFVVVGAIVLHGTRFGRFTYAVGSNEEAARRVGLEVDRHLIKVYALSGLLAGVAGI